jgi:hypothetical protein
MMLMVLHTCRQHCHTCGCLWHAQVFTGKTFDEWYDSSFRNGSKCAPLPCLSHDFRICAQRSCPASARTSALCMHAAGALAYMPGGGPALP